MHINAYIWNPENGTHEPICRAGVQTRIYTENGLWTQWGGRGWDELRE